MVKRILTEHPDRDQGVLIIGTGGLINLLAPYTSVIDHVDPMLTLSGLRIIYERVFK
jgi:type III pantothenate kinase